MSKRNGKPIHGNALKPSTKDTINLGIAVHERFLRVCEDWKTIRLEEIKIPFDLDPDILLWRTMMVRFKAGDFRNTRSELDATKVVAQWTVDVNAKLRGQPDVAINWGD